MTSRVLPDHELVTRYRSVYHLDDEAVGAPEVHAHWALERRLTSELWNSTPTNRWEIFSRCYTELYEALPWLNTARETDAPPEGFPQWAALIREPSEIFEIGSGKAQLLRSLSELGHRCTATEITKERGAKHADTLRWELTDGIHLADFVAQQFDVVISTGVIEHFHPDDLPVHFEHARKILRPAGRYLLTTPHAGSGPHDLSVVFNLDQPECMHLKEYDYSTLAQLLTQAGFRRIRAVFPPSRVFRRVGFTAESRAYLAYLRAFDLDRYLRPGARRRLRRFAKALLVPDNIWISAEV